MKKQDVEKLVTSVRQAGPGREYEYRPADIKAIREKLELSQPEFALMIGVSVATLRNWEQGRRSPEGPARALLRIAEKNPQALVEALGT